MSDSAKRVSELTNRMIERLDDIGFMDSWFYHLIDHSMIRLCESPIEIMLGAALLFKQKFDGDSGEPLSLASYDEFPAWPAESFLLVPQFKFGEYRIDWALRDGPFLTFIECDGHDFHERTKNQAARDKQRDRNIQAAGHPILRFTGSEIYKDPFHCAGQILTFVGDRHIPVQFRESV